MSLALPSIGKLGVAISIVGPSHRFADEAVASVSATRQVRAISSRR